MYRHLQANEIRQSKVTIINFNEVRTLFDIRILKNAEFQCKWTSVLINNAKKEVQILILILHILMA
jgi:hypothetical protein